MLQVEITDLLPYTNYTVQVAGVTDRGDQGTLSEPTSVLTAEACMSISMPCGMYNQLMRTVALLYSY